ncbi:POTE ankyrin domain family member B-like isoform X2 [Anser cygnoides]|uniref:POTE ankyrin domain family member B-like isoform X2 n=1 Tax=Anser cygnoides TaxID=8845 RepID=UPI0034D3144F
MQRLLGLLHRGQEHPMPSSTSLSRDSDAHQLPEEGLHGLHRAAARGDLARLRRHWWLKKRGKNRRDQAKRTPLHLACANGHADVVRFLVQEKCLLNLCDNTGRSPLMMAVESQHEECVAILLEHRADPNLEGYRGKSALHLAAAAPNTSVAEMLVEHGAHLEAKDCERNTPLLLAISSHHKEMVKFLLQKGANVCARNFFGRTALTLAASAGETDVIELLLSYGANIACDTAVDYALRSGHSDLCKKLVEHARCEKTGEASAGAAQDTAVPSRFCSPRTERFALATLALDGEGALPAVGAEQEEEAELPWDRKDQDRQLQLELPGAPESLSVSEAPPEATESQLSDTEKDVERLQEELEMVKAKVEASEQACIESEVWVKYLETVLEDKKREAAASSQKVQGFLEPSFGTGALQKLEERMQGLKAGSDRLEATIQQQSRLIEALQRHQQASASARNHPEDLVTAFQSAQTTADGHPHQQHQCQRTEEKLVELKCPVEVRLEQEMKSNSELRRECLRLRRLLNGALQKLRESEARERKLMINTARDMTSSCSEGASEADKLTAKLNELSQQLEMESGKCRQLEAQNCDLQEELSALRGSQEKMEKSNGQLQEEVACIKALLKTYKTQAASPDVQELTRSPPCTSLGKSPKHRSRDADSEEEDVREKTPQDHTFPYESMQERLENYRYYYLEEVNLRRCLQKDLKRTRQRLAEVKAQLHQKHH